VIYTIRCVSLLMTNYFSAVQKRTANQRMEVISPGFAELVRSAMTQEKWAMPFAIGQHPRPWFFCAGEAYRPEGADKVALCVEFARKRAKLGGALDAYRGQDGYDVSKFLKRFQLTKYLFSKKNVEKRIKIFCYNDKNEMVDFRKGRYCRLAYVDEGNALFERGARFVEIEYDCVDHTYTGVLMCLLYRLICQYPVGVISEMDCSPVTFLAPDCQSIKDAFNPDGKVMGIYWDRFDTYHNACKGGCTFATQDMAYSCWDVCQYMEGDEHLGIAYDWFTSLCFGIKAPDCGQCGEKIVRSRLEELDISGLSSFTFDEKSNGKERVPAVATSTRYMERPSTYIHQQKPGEVAKLTMVVSPGNPGVKAPIEYPTDYLPPPPPTRNQFTFPRFDGTILVDRLIDDLPDFDLEDSNNFKGRLQEECVTRGQMPIYDTLHTGVSHVPTFYAVCQPGNGKAYVGVDSTKKGAEMRAARAAIYEAQYGLVGVSIVDLYSRCKKIYGGRYGVFDGKEIVSSVPPEPRMLKGSAFVHVCDGKVGLISERPGKPWNLPGGTSIGDESALETMLREASEELGEEVARRLVFTRFLVSQHANASCTVYYCQHDGEVPGLTYYRPGSFPPNVAPWVLRVLWDAQGRARNEAYMTLTRLYPDIGGSSFLDGPFYSIRKGEIFMVDRRNPQAVLSAMKTLGALNTAHW